MSSGRPGYSQWAISAQRTGRWNYGGLSGSRSETGNVWITNTGALTVGGVSDGGVEAYGTVTIVANSSVIMDGNIHVFGAGEDIIVTSTDGAWRLLHREERYR